MTIRKTMKWFVMIVLVAGLFGGGYAYHLWSRSGEILREGIHDALAEMAPGWTFEIGRAPRFDWSRRIHVYDMTIKASEQGAPIVTFPEVVLTIDTKTLATEQRVDVLKIRLRNPQFHLSRHSNGQWNWQSLTPIKPRGQSWPEWEIEQGVVHVRMQSTDNETPVNVMLRHLVAKLIPSGKNEYVVQAAAEVQQNSKLTVDGSWNANEKTWTVESQLKNVTTRGDWLRLLESTSPEIRAQLDKIRAALMNATPESQRSGWTAATQASFGVDCDLDLSLRVSRKNPSVEPDFTLIADIRAGQISNPALPFPFHDVGGTVYCDNQQVQIRELTAHYGSTQVALDGSLMRAGQAPASRLNVSIRNLAFNERLRNRLPSRWRKYYDQVRPRGRCDLRGTLTHSGDTGWRPSGFVLSAKGCTASYVKFPYPVQGVQGTIEQVGAGDLKMSFEGLVGRRPAQLTGLIKNAGPAAESRFSIRVKQLPLDHEFVNACGQLPHLKTTLEALKLEGLVDAEYHIFRPPGFNRRFQIQIHASVNDGTIQYRHFPYRLSDLTGTMTYSTESKTWSFQNLQAVHGPARIRGSGTFIKRSAKDPGALRIEIVAAGAPLDGQLERALSEPLQKLWDALSPTKGKLDVATQIHWVPGSEPNIKLTDARVYDAALVMKPFPYPLEDIEAWFSYDSNQFGHVDIHSFTARHDDTRLRAHGFADASPAGEWRLRINKLHAADMIPDRLLRRALPQDLRDVMDELNPQQPISFSGMLDLRGIDRPDSPVTAAWNFTFVFSGNKMTTGVDLEQVRGEVTTIGNLDHLGRVNCSGAIDLDSLYFWGYQCTQVRGPYRVKNNELIVGSPAAFLPDVQQAAALRIPPHERVTARTFGGQLTLDARVGIQDIAPYDVRMTLTRASLKEFATQHLRGVRDVSGDANGWIALNGQGPSPDQLEGRGQLEIDKAKLYQLPVLVQIFNRLSFVPSDSTAFKYAIFDYKVAKQTVQFDSIDLRGDAIELRGHGTAGFDGSLRLRFGSRIPKQRIAIPILNTLVNEVTKDWVGVRVDGKLSDPKATIVPVPRFDEARRRMIRSFEPPPRVANPAPKTPLRRGANKRLPR